MPERKPWSQREDEILRELKEERGVKKWSEIGRLMQREFGAGERTGKQCRQRYHNHLEAGIVTAEWSAAEEAVLSAAHEEVGNKWSLIAQRLPGRSDNCVKNHFYSKLRKAARRLNRAIHYRLRRTHRDVKLSLLNRIVETTEERFKPASRLDPQAVAHSLALTQRLFRLDQTSAVDIQKEQRELIEQLGSFEVRSMKEHKASLETNCGRENGEEPNLMEIFRRVCEQIMHDQP